MNETAVISTQSIKYFKLKLTENSLQFKQILIVQFQINCCGMESRSDANCVTVQKYTVAVTDVDDHQAEKDYKRSQEDCTKGQEHCYSLSQEVDKQQRSKSILNNPQPGKHRRPVVFMANLQERSQYFTKTSLLCVYSFLSVREISQDATGRNSVG